MSSSLAITSSSSVSIPASSLTSRFFSAISSSVNSMPSLVKAAVCNFNRILINCLLIRRASILPLGFSKLFRHSSNRPRLNTVKTLFFTSTILILSNRLLGILANTDFSLFKPNHFHISNTKILSKLSNFLNNSTFIPVMDFFKLEIGINSFGTLITQN